jgi:hypothetical protein
MTSSVGSIRLLELVYGPRRRLRYHEHATHKVTKSALASGRQSFHLNTLYGPCGRLRYHEQTTHVNGRGYLRVTKKSLWWQHELFPSVWTSEGLTTCMENGYQWTVNSTTWCHLQTMWQAPPLDLLRLIYEETHHQTILEARGYRSPTWRILRALKSILQANVVVGESTITAAPFFEGAGRPSKSFWGPQQGL